VNGSKVLRLVVGLLVVAACSPITRASPDATAFEPQWGPIAAYRSDGRMEARNEDVLVLTDRCTFLGRGVSRGLVGRVRV
jgi:hypothetical protein